MRAYSGDDIEEKQILHAIRIEDVGELPEGQLAVVPK